MAYAGNKALVKVGGNPVSFTNETTTPNGSLTVFQIADTLKQIWDREATIAVERSTDSGSTWDALDPETDGYKLNRLSGSVVFDNARQSGTDIRVSGDYIPTSTAAECHEWSSTQNSALMDVSRFQNQWTEKIPGLKSAEGSLSRWWSIDTYFADALLSGQPALIELYPQDDLPPNRIWGVITSDEMSAAVDGVIEDAVSFESTNEMLNSYITKG